MASFQLDFKNDIGSIFKLVDNFTGSKTQIKIINAHRYYDGDNATIMDLPDRTYWSDRKILDSAGNQLYDANNNPIKVNGEVRNPFVSNNRIPYGIFHDIVSQKVNTLLDEPPIIDCGNYELSNDIIKQLGYSLKQGAVEASISGKAYVFLNSNNKSTVFNTAYCIPFFDDYTGSLRALIRIINRVSEFNTALNTKIVEVYEEAGLTIYERKNGAEPTLYKAQTPYKYTIKKSVITNEIENNNPSTLPIIIIKNNEKCESDLTPSVRAKIDIIDIVQSGFANNIDDFSDVFWFIKASAGDTMTSDDYEDFLANINKTKRIFAEQATPQQFNIPTEARSKFVELMKQQLIEETGVIDSQGLVATQLTTVAIKAATMKLRQRVSDFEWFVYQATGEYLDLYKAYNNIVFNYEINFTKLIIDNNTEIIDNLVKVENLMSLDDKLKKLKQAGMIDDIEATKKALEEESNYKLTDEPIDNLDIGGEEDGGQST